MPTNEECKDPASFSDYPPTPLSPSIRESLAQGWDVVVTCEVPQESLHKYPLSKNTP